MIHWRIEMEKSKWKKIVTVVGVVVGMLTIMGNLGWVTYNVAKSNTIAENMESFRLETLKGTSAQILINAQLQEQLKELQKSSEEHKRRLNRLDRQHKNMPLDWKD